MNSTKIGKDSEDKLLKEYISQGYFGGKLVKKIAYKYRTIRFKSRFDTRLIAQILRQCILAPDDSKRLFLARFGGCDSSCKGYPDFIFLTPNKDKILFVEVKTNKNKMFTDQIIISNTLKENGFDVILRNFENWGNIENLERDFETERSKDEDIDSED